MKKDLIQCVNILDEATQPQNAGKISREGYVAISQALQFLKQYTEQLPDEEEAKKEI